MLRVYGVHSDDYMYFLGDLDECQRYRGKFRYPYEISQFNIDEFCRSYNSIVDSPEPTGLVLDYLVRKMPSGFDDVEGARFVSLKGEEFDLFEYLMI